MNDFARRLCPLPITAIAIVFAACGGQSIPTHPSMPSMDMASMGPRPSSPATVEIVQPAPSTTVTGPTAHVVLRLNGGRIVQETTTNIRPDEGHVHLYVNNQLVSMNYGLEQDIPVQPGTLVLKAEFVAADHAPFSPRVYSPETVFTVR